MPLIPHLSVLPIIFHILRVCPRYRIHKEEEESPPPRMLSLKKISSASYVISEEESPEESPRHSLGMVVGESSFAMNGGGGDVEKYRNIFIYKLSKMVIPSCLASYKSISYIYKTYIICQIFVRG